MAEALSKTPCHSPRGRKCRLLVRKFLLVVPCSPRAACQPCGLLRGRGPSWQCVFPQLISQRKQNLPQLEGFFCENPKAHVIKMVRQSTIAYTPTTVLYSLIRSWWDKSSSNAVAPLHKMNACRVEFIKTCVRFNIANL